MKTFTRHSWKTVACSAGIAIWTQVPAHAQEPDPPNCTHNRYQDYFASEAIRKAQFGAVVVEYSIDSTGIPNKAIVLETTAPKSLQNSALRLVNNMRCDPDEAWIANGGPDKRFKLNVVFQYRGDEPVKAIDPESETVTITGVRALKPSRR